MGPTLSAINGKEKKIKIHLPSLFHSFNKFKKQCKKFLAFYFGSKALSSGYLDVFSIWTEIITHHVQKPQFRFIIEKTLKDT